MYFAFNIAYPLHLKNTLTCIVEEGDKPASNCTDALCLGLLIIKMIVPQSTVHHCLNLDQQNSETDPSTSDPQTVEPNLDKLLEDF